MIKKRYTTLLFKAHDLRTEENQSKGKSMPEGKCPPKLGNLSRQVDLGVSEKMLHILKICFSVFQSNSGFPNHNKKHILKHVMCFHYFLLCDKIKEHLIEFKGNSIKEKKGHPKRNKSSFQDE